MQTDQLCAYCQSYPRDKLPHCSDPPAVDPRTAQIVEHLGNLAWGLFFMSESDYPLVTISWPDEKGRLFPDSILRLTGHPPETPIEETTLDTFFRPAVSERDGQTDEERASAARFRALVQGIEGDLSDVHVYRVGTITIDVYIVGRAPDDTLVGLATRVIET